MRKIRLLALSGIAAMSLAFTACSSGADSTTEASSADANASSADTGANAEATDAESSENGEEVDAQSTDSEAAGGFVEIEDIHGTVEVPVNPEVVVSLDNRTFETLSDWGIELAAVPKSVMPADSSYVADDAVIDIGDHREPDLEALAALEPDLVIIGQRFVDYYDEIKELVPNAVVIDFSFDVSEDAATPGDNLVNGLKDSTTALGKIFDKEAEAEELNTEFDEAIERVKTAYNGTDTVISVVVSGGEIGYSAPKSGRVWGPLYDVFGFQSAIEVANTTSDHQGDDISIEAIAQANPDWILVLDRDAAVSSEDGAAAKDVIENAPALSNLTAITEDHIVYAPNDTYTNESIQTFLEIFDSLAEAFENAN